MTLVSALGKCNIHVYKNFSMLLPESNLSINPKQCRKLSLSAKK